MINKCNECQLFEGRHTFLCTSQSDEGKLKNFDKLSRNYMSAFKRADRHLRSSIDWHGRYAIVKNENNELRKNIHKQKKGV